MSSAQDKDLLEQAERYFKETQNQWDVLTQQEELRQIDRNWLMV